MEKDFTASAQESGTIAQDHSVAAGPGGVAVGRDVHAPVVVAGEGAQVTVTVQGENLRDKELSYLDALLVRHERWRDRYTPMAGIAEVRAAVQEDPDPLVPYVPPEFEKLEEYGFGGRPEVRRVPVADLCEAVSEHRRILLLGEPGSGKTTTLWRLCYDYATAAQQDPHNPLPVLVSLGGYTDSSPFDVYLGHHLGPLAPYLETYRASGRLILLLDGLNELPQTGYAERVGRINDVVDRWPEEMVVVTCRALDYVVKLKGLQKVEVSPLDEARILTFLQKCLDKAQGEQLFWAMAGGDEVHALWDTWQTAGETWAQFWTAEYMPEAVYTRTSPDQYLLWSRLRKEPPALLALGRNPYLLLMTAQVYRRAAGELPANRARLFKAFVGILMERERRRHAAQWVDEKHQTDALANLAYAMQAKGERGTTVDRAWALGQLQQAAPDFDAEQLLYLATSATLLDADGATVRFYHHLLQEYFAALEMGKRVAADEPLSTYWPPERWWEPTGWEETVILLAGMEPDASRLLTEMSSANPVIAARCLLEGEARVDAGTRARITEALVEGMTSLDLPAVARARAGDALARLGDPRPGVGLRLDGLPDIAWCEVPAGSFLMGSDMEQDEQVDDREFPQREVDLSAYSIAKYPVTNAQYAAFVAAGGYGERRYWTGPGWKWEGRHTGPESFGGAFDLPNHPVVMIGWYEAVAFCRWLTERLRREGDLGPDQEVRLPTEAEWEKAARGTDGRIYPWGNEFDPEKCNSAPTDIHSTSAVGCFPGGAGPYSVEDLSGNMWEWCRTKWRTSYREAADESPEGVAYRVTRGGCFLSPDGRSVRCAYRISDLQEYGRNDRGFRVVVVPVPSEL